MSEKAKKSIELIYKPSRTDIYSANIGVSYRHRPLCGRNVLWGESRVLSNPGYRRDSCDRFLFWELNLYLTVENDTSISSSTFVFLSIWYRRGSYCIFADWQDPDPYSSVLISPACNHLANCKARSHKLLSHSSSLFRCQECVAICWLYFDGVPITSACQCSKNSSTNGSIGFWSWQATFSFGLCSPSIRQHVQTWRVLSEKVYVVRSRWFAVVSRWL